MVGGATGRAHDPVVAGRSGLVDTGRRPRRPRPARCWPSGSGWPGRATAAWSSRRRSAARPAATPGCSIRREGMVEVAYYADDFVVLHEAAHAWFNGAPARRSLGERGVRLVLRPRGRRPRSRSRPSGDALTPALEAARIPLNALGRRSGARRARPRTTPTPRRSRWPARSPSAPGPTALRAVWADAAGAGRGVPAAGRGPAASAPAATAARDGRRAARLARPARPARGARRGARSTTCGGPGSSRDSDLPLLDARQAARARYDAVRRGGRRLAAAAADPRRDARLAVRHGDGAARRRDRAILDQRDGDRGRGRRPPG